VDEMRRPITIVTGAGRGIGAATAQHLAKTGHDVVVNYRQDHGAAARVVDMARASGARAIAVQADVTLEGEVTRLFAVVYEALGPVRCLVNNAGATLHIADLADTPVVTVRAVIDVNLLGTILYPQGRGRPGSRHAVGCTHTARASCGSARDRRGDCLGYWGPTRRT
jgi:glucose 1-dehydrogenase